MFVFFFYDKVDEDGKKKSFISVQNLPTSFQNENPHFGHIHGKPETAHWTEAPG